MKGSFRRPHFFLPVILLTTFLVALHSSCATSQQAQQQASTKANTEQELRKLYERLMEAGGKKDEKALREILAESYSQVTTCGVVRDKETRVRETLSPDDQLKGFAIEDFRLRLYSDAAVAVARVSYQGVYKGKDYAATVLSTVTFVREGAVWRIAATHLTLPNDKRGDYQGLCGDALANRAESKRSSLS